MNPAPNLDQRVGLRRSRRAVRAALTAIAPVRRATLALAHWKRWARDRPLVLSDPQCGRRVRCHPDHPRARGLTSSIQCWFRRSGLACIAPGGLPLPGSLCFLGFSLQASCGPTWAMGRPAAERDLASLDGQALVLCAGSGGELRAGLYCMQGCPSAKDGRWLMGKPAETTQLRLLRAWPWHQQWIEVTGSDPALVAPWWCGAKRPTRQVRAGRASSQAGRNALANGLSFRHDQLTARAINLGWRHVLDLNCCALARPPNGAVPPGS